MMIKNIFNYLLSPNHSKVESDNTAVSKTTTTKMIESSVIEPKENTMSFISSFKNHFEDIENLFKKLFKSEPTWAQVAETDIAFVSPIVESIVATVGGAAADKAVTAVITSIQNGLVLATKFIQDADASANLADVLDTLKADLGTLLALAAIKNSTKVETITNYVNLFVGELDAILAVLPKVVAAKAV